MITSNQKVDISLYFCRFLNFIYFFLGLERSFYYLFNKPKKQTKRPLLLSTLILKIIKNNIPLSNYPLLSISPLIYLFYLIPTLFLNSLILILGSPFAILIVLNLLNSLLANLIKNVYMHESFGFFLLPNKKTFLIFGLKVLPIFIMLL